MTKGEGFLAEIMSPEGRKKKDDEDDQDFFESDRDSRSFELWKISQIQKSRVDFWPLDLP